MRATIWRLSPVMSWMFITFHSPDESGVHAIWQVLPALKTCPGLGAEGVGSAKATKAKDRTKAEKVPRENISNKRLRQRVTGGSKTKKKDGEKAKIGRERGGKTTNNIYLLGWAERRAEVKERRG